MLIPSVFFFPFTNFMSCNLFRRFNPFPNNKILNSSELKKLADNNFKFDENDRKFSRRVENTMGKGYIAH